MSKDYINLARAKVITSSKDFERLILKLSEHKDFFEDTFKNGKIINVPYDMFVSLRSYPSVSSDVLKKFPNDTELIFLNKEQISDGKTFLNVEIDGVIGWISSSFVEYYNEDGSIKFKGIVTNRPKIVSITEEEDENMSEESMSEDWKEFAPKLAEEVQQKYGVPKQITMCQFALESNFGKSESGNFNYFGIKGKGSAGSKNLKTTEEFVPGNKIKINDNFASYSSKSDSFNSYGSLLSSSQRYRYATQNFSDKPGMFIIWIWANGYATDSAYPTKIASVSKRVASTLGDSSFEFQFSSKELDLISQLSSETPENRRTKIKQLFGVA